VDIFNDSEAEWFEVVWIPQDKLTEIFADSLRLLNPKSASHLQLAKLWWLVSLTSIVALVIVLVFVLVKSSQNVKIYDQTLNLPLVIGSELVFKDIVIDTTNQAYEFTLSSNLPTDFGLSLSTTFLDSRKQISSSGNVELVNAPDFGRTHSNSFYPSKQEAYSLIVRLDDFGKVGVPAEQDTSLSTTTETIPIRLEVYKAQITADQGWYTTGLGIVLLIMFARYRRKRNEEKAWQYYSPRKLKVKS